MPTRKAMRAGLVYQRREQRASTRQDQPQIEVEEHAFDVSAARRFKRKIGAAAVFYGDKSGAQGADVAAQGVLGFVHNLRPGIDGIAGECGGHVAAAVDGGDMKGVGKAVEG